MDENQDTRCSSCGARLPADAEWCTLCYAVQRAVADPEPEPAPAAAAVPTTGGGCGPVAGATTRPSASAGLVTASDPAEALALADQLLARLAAESRPIPSPGLLGRSLSTAYGRAGVAAIGVGAVTFAVLALMGAGGSIL